MARQGTTGLVLAGGRGSRWGGRDKGLIEVSGEPMIQHVLRRFEPQVDTVIISANRNLERYRACGFPVVPDDGSELLGPLGGIVGGLSAARTDWVAVVPCDAPLLASDCVERLGAARSADEQIDLVAAHDGTRIQPLFALLHRRLLGDLQAFLESGGRRTDQWYGRQRMKLVDFSDRQESFLNINRPEDLDWLEARLERGAP